MVTSVCLDEVKLLVNLKKTINLLGKNNIEISNCKVRLALNVIHPAVAKHIKIEYFIGYVGTLLKM